MFRQAGLLKLVSYSSSFFLLYFVAEELVKGHELVFLSFFLIFLLQSFLLKQDYLGWAVFIWILISGMTYRREEYWHLPMLIPSFVGQYMDEIVCLLFFAGVLFRVISDNSRRVKFPGFLPGIVLFLVWSLISGFYNEISMVTCAKATLTFLKPFIIFWSVANLEKPYRFANNLWKVLIVFCVLNMFVGFFQFLTPGAGDRICGLTREQNTLALLFFDVSLLFFVRFWLAKNNRLFSFICFILLALAGLAPSWIIATISFAISLAIASLFCRNDMFSAKQAIVMILRIAFISVIGVMGFFMIDMFDPVFKGVVEKEVVYLDRPAVRAYSFFIEEASKDPMNLVFGFGPGNYGSTMALGNAFKGEGSKITYKLLVNIKSSLGNLTNGLIGIAGEFGLPVLFMLLWGLGWLLNFASVSWKKYYGRSSNKCLYEAFFDRNSLIMINGIAMVFVMHLGISAVYTQDTFGEPYFLIPQFALLGGYLSYFFRKSEKSRKV